MAYLGLRVFHYVVWPIVLLLACRWWFGPIRRLAFPWAFLLGWLLLIHADAVEIFLTEYPYPSFLIAVWVTPLLVLISAGPLMRALGHSPPELDGIALGDAPSDRDRLILQLTPYLTVAVIALDLLYVADVGVKNVALFFAFANPGSAAEAMILRLSGLHSRLSPVLTIVYSYSRALLLPAYGAVVTVLFVTRRIGRGHWLIALAAVTMFMVFQAAKAPLAYVLIGSLLAAYLARPRSLRVGRMALLLVLAMFVPALIYPLLTGERGLGALGVAGSHLWERVTYVPSVASAQYFDAFPAVHPYLGAASNRLLATIANVPTVSTPSWIYDRYLDDGILHGGKVNAAFFANFYADWGMFGVLAGGILVGVTLLALQLYFDRRGRPDALSIGVQASTLIAVMQLLMSDYYGTALGRGMLSLPILLWCFDVITRRRVGAVVGKQPLTGVGTL